MLTQKAGRARAWTAVAALAAGPAGGAAGQPLVFLEDFSSQGFTTSYFVNGISGDGWSVCLDTMTAGNGNYRYFVDFGFDVPTRARTSYTPSFLDGTNTAHPWRLSTDGAIAVGLEDSGPFSVQYPALWTSPASAPIRLPGGAWVTWTMSNSGELLASDAGTAFRWWRGGAVTTSAGYPGASSAVVSRVCNAEVACGWVVASGSSIPVVCAFGGEITALPRPAGVSQARALCLSADGRRVFGTSWPTGTLIVWTDGQPTTYANQTVTRMDCTLDGRKAFSEDGLVWEEGAGVRSLGAYLAGLGYNTSGYTLFETVRISGDAGVIAAHVRRTGLTSGVFIASPGLCLADYNRDGFLDFFDYSDFVACFEGSCAAGRTADFNQDGFADFFDYDAYLAAFEAGC